MTENKTLAAIPKVRVKRKPAARKAPPPRTVEEFKALGLEKLMARMTKQQLTFAHAYDRSGCSIAALREASPASAQWTRNAADVRAYQLKNTPVVRAFRELILEERLARHNDALDVVVTRLLGIVRSDLSTVSSFEGGDLRLLPYKDMSPGARASLKKFKVTYGAKGEVTYEVEQHAPTPAAATLGRLLGLEKPTDIRHSGAIDLHSLKLEHLPDEILEKWAAEYGGS